jgi:ribonuclease H2 subunit B
MQTTLTECMNAAIPALFLPYRLDASTTSADASEWGILEVQSVSPPNQRSWFFTEGQVVSGKSLLVSPRCTVDAKFVE